MTSFKYLYINSTLAFVAAFIITTIIHEGGHFIAYLLFDANPIMYHNYVHTPDQSLADYVKIIAALAGPFISLLQGIIFWIFIKVKSRNDDAGLMNLWLCLLGFINFFGYLMLTPLSTEGDTGKASQLLQIPYMFRILIAAFGLLIIILIVIKTGKFFARFIPDQTEISGRRKYISSLAMFPIITGSIINSLLAFPLPSILSIIYPATSSFVIMSAYSIILKSKSGFVQKSILEDKISIRIISILVIFFIIKSLLSMGLNIS
jgi:hypothetical protein